MSTSEPKWKEYRMEQLREIGHKFGVRGKSKISLCRRIARKSGRRINHLLSDSSSYYKQGGQEEEEEKKNNTVFSLPFEEKERSKLEGIKERCKNNSITTIELQNELDNYKSVVGKTKKQTCDQVDNLLLEDERTRTALSFSPPYSPSVIASRPSFFERKKKPPSFLLLTSEEKQGTRTKQISFEQQFMHFINIILKSPASKNCAGIIEDMILWLLYQQEEIQKQHRLLLLSRSKDDPFSYQCKRLKGTTSPSAEEFVANYMIMVTLEKPEYQVQVSPEIRQYIHACDYPIHIIPLVLWQSDMGSGHANLLIIDQKKKTIERFEPHGKFSLFYDHAKLEKTITKEVLPKLGLNNFIYFEPYQWECPNIGPQSKEGKNVKVEQQRLCEGGGFCVVYSTLIGHLRIAFPEKTTKEITERLLQFSAVEILNIIRRYLQIMETALPEREGNQYFYKSFVSNEVLPFVKKSSSSTSSKDPDPTTWKKFNDQFIQLGKQMKKEANEGKVSFTKSGSNGFSTYRENETPAPWPGETPFVRKLELMQKYIEAYPNSEEGRYIKVSPGIGLNLVNHQPLSNKLYHINKRLEWSSDTIEKVFKAFHLKPNLQFFKDVADFNLTKKSFFQF